MLSVAPESSAVASSVDWFAAEFASAVAVVASAIVVAASAAGRAEALAAFAPSPLKP